ncbi:glycerol-3-phosphate ABC transporter ATP-binding protein [candidate division TA06 bacterium DG_24]|uniref:Glycerol-3-phosphate ABC transporter ATP-binding protein n=2 Tax=Bacteria division TA06 TaxID=1156500 RepID=A0A0S8JQ50_UNCT6|nr:MAG: glycerol-3-phosphate ABC transporter ATP-binding protein [candidate division TA06 bacterium DG_24]KPL11586.1 MAG: glycerol-3-phosphate ABC transporter ATP-binding protein [candidate division TA06 bacterium SM1_40]
MATVELRDVTKRFGRDVVAVDHISFAVADQEFVVLVGPSGCGKSTVLRLIAGLEEVTSGDVVIDGRVVNTDSPRDRDIAMVFQNYALYPHMTVFDNMAFGLKLRRHPRQKVLERVRGAASLLGIEHLLHRKPRELSGGERQRVAVGRAIVRKPKVFLFDEPLSNLDARLRVQMRAELSRLHQHLGTTMIYVTHDQVEAMTMGNRIVVLKQGRLQQIDDPMSLYRQPRNSFVAQFIGSPAMNLVEAKWDGERSLTLDAEWLLIDIPPAIGERLGGTSREVFFGIRPEHIVWRDAGGGTAGGVGDVQLRAEVEVVEPMGSEILLHFRAGEGTMVAKVSATKPPAVGDVLEFGFSLERAHFFDAGTGDSI